MNSTTTEARPHPLADPKKAFDALMATGAALRRHVSVHVKGEEGDAGRVVDRSYWLKAVGNVIKSPVFSNDQRRKLKALRDELRRTKVKA